MTRAQRFAIIAGIFSALYILAYFSVLPIPLLEDETKNEILPVLPWWLLVSFGSYTLWSIGWALLTIRECPEAYQELLSEITTAKNELRMHGVSVD